MQYKVREILSTQIIKCINRKTKQIWYLVKIIEYILSETIGIDTWLRNIGIEENEFRLIILCEIVGTLWSGNTSDHCDWTTEPSVICIQYNNSVLNNDRSIVWLKFHHKIGILSLFPFEISIASFNFNADI